jgi:hypothetical protein
VYFARRAQPDMVARAKHMALKREVAREPAVLEAPPPKTLAKNPARMQGTPSTV